MLLSLQRINAKKLKYERGLSMVPMLIHLPPASEDTEVNGRDVRDLVDENISKAQIIYNIIASTIEQSFKNRFHGQRRAKRIRSIIRCGARRLHKCCAASYC